MYLDFHLEETTSAIHLFFYPPVEFLVPLQQRWSTKLVKID